MDPSEVSVLVVEDDEFTRVATLDILRSCRYQVQSVDDGKQALDLLQNNHGKIDLVLCDVMLPVLNGIQLLDALQSDENSATLGHIPVVMTSSNEEMDVVTSCLSRGAKDYLIKPIQVNTAKTLVRHVWLSRKLEKHAPKTLWKDIEVIRRIGKGTHGTVQLARRKVDGAVVAVKRVKLSEISENGRKQADNEVILLKSLYHVNIVRFYDHFLADDDLNIVMEYADGGNLRQLVKRRVKDGMGPFHESTILSWFAQLVLAVSYIHGKNVLHRDLKAQNVFLTRRNVVKLGDFGISKALSGDESANTACGTPESMSPEICRGEPYGKKSDIWSLGCILYEMINLARPFEASTLPEIFQKICKGEYPPIPNEFSRELRLLVQLMLQQDQSKRPSIEDICRFPFVQAPIQAFLNQHVAEFQEALELEAKLHQPNRNIQSSDENANAPISVSEQSGVSENATDGSNSEQDASTNVGIGQFQPPGSVGRKQMPDDPMEAVNEKFAPAPLRGEDNANSHLADSAMASAVVGLSVESTPGFHHQASMDISSNVNPGMEDSVLDEVRAQLTVGSIRIGFFTTHANCVSATELVGVLHRHFGKTAEEAGDLLRQYVSAGDLQVVAAQELDAPDLERPDTLLRFRVDDDSVPLNQRYACPEEMKGQSAMETALSVREAMAELHAMDEFPSRISMGFQKEDQEAPPFHAAICRQYRKFVRLSNALQHVDMSTLPKHERQAFFINVFNTQALHALIEFGRPETLNAVRTFEKEAKYAVGGLLFSLSDIKHGILRCNRKPPANYWERQLHAQDARLHYMLHIRDPRSLLVLVDCSEPAPPPEDVPILKPGRTDTELEEQAMRFCSEKVGVDQDAMEVWLPRLFRTFRDDFGASEAEMVSWLAQYMDDAPIDLYNYKVKFQAGRAM